MLPKIAFCHIHKTAGTTVSRYLRSNYPLEAIFPADGLEGVNQSLIDRINNYSLIVGHFPLSFLRTFLSSDWKIVTVLRDPVARFKSHVSFSLELAPAESRQAMVRELLEGAQSPQPFGDFQTRFIGAWLSSDEWRYLISSGLSRRYHLSEEWNRGGIESAMRIAAEELDHIPFVIDSADLDAGMRRLAMACRLWPFERLPVSNRGSYRAETPGVGEAIHALALANNKVDTQLMDLVRSRFALAPADSEWLAYQASWMGHFAVSHSAFIAPDHQFFASGWHERETSLEGGTFCWSDSSLGQDIYLPLTTPGHYEVEIALFLPGGQSDFTMSLEYAGATYDATTVKFRKTEWAYCSFRILEPVTDVTKLSRFVIRTNCSPRPRSPGDLRDTGFVFCGALARVADARVWNLGA